MSTSEEILVLAFLGAVTIWLFARPGGVRDRVLLFAAGTVMVALMMGLYWLVRPQEDKPGQIALYQILGHVMVVVAGGALVGFSVRLARDRGSRKPPDAPIS